MVTVKNGRCTFRLFYPHAQQVHVVGDFNGWAHNHTPLQRTPDNGWEIRIELPPGEYRFRYLIDGHRWLTDWAAFGAIPNRIDGWDSVLVVDTPTSAKASPPAPATPLIWRRTS